LKLPRFASFVLLFPWSFVAAQTQSLAPRWAGASILDPVNSELPDWLRFGGEYRVRFEGFENSRFRTENADYYTLHRVRLNLLVQPSSSIRLFVQGQDARVWGVDRIGHVPPYQDTFDLRQAFLQLGSDSGPVALEVGRQEISFGEQRLVGASNWANTARTFDAVRLDLKGHGMRVAAFAASVVVQIDGRFDHHNQGNNLHGFYSGFDRLIPKATVEPYFFWRLAPRVRSETGAFGKLDSRTAGVRISGAITKRLRYVTEMAMQHGNSAVDRVSAWAGHWRIEQVLADRWTPRLRFESDYATGDRNPNDARNNTFDVLYPTPHDKYGLADQVGWKNVRHLGATFEIQPISGLAIQTRAHTWWLASERDGLYNAPGNLIVRDPTGRSGRHVGEEIDFQALWSAGKRVNLGAGVGHLFPGEFLKKTTPAAGYTFPYFMVTYEF
jgi:hypothetical protein